MSRETGKQLFTALHTHDLQILFLDAEFRYFKKCHPTLILWIFETFTIFSVTDLISTWHICRYFLLFDTLIFGWFTTTPFHFLLYADIYWLLGLLHHSSIVFSTNKFFKHFFDPIESALRTITYVSAPSLYSNLYYYQYLKSFTSINKSL